MSLRDVRRAVLDRRDLHGDEFCRALAGATDAWLAELLDRATGGDERGLGLVAVGGYGRGELSPGSDLDLILVHQRRRDVGAVADAVWYPVWDEAVRLDHSVRRPAEALEVAAADLRAQLGLLDGRLVAGDSEVVTPLLAKAAALWRRQAERWLPVLARQVDERHRAHGDVAFLLEPDLKESHGGLRDVHVVTAAARAVPTLAEEVDLASLDEPRRVLTAVRVELHRTTGRGSDRLLLQEQDQVAAALGLADADTLMAAVAEAGRTIAWVSDDVWRRRPAGRTARRRQPVLGLRRRDRAPGAGAARPAEPGVALVGEPEADGRGDVVVIGADADLDGDPGLPLRLAAVAAEGDRPIARAALDQLARHTPAPPVPWTSDLRGAFIRVLAAGPPAITALETLDQRGLFSRLVPEWSAVRNRPQRNAFHRFTVDRHLLEAAAEAAALAGGVSRPDLLLVAALFHDIGKGFPGDHTEAGIVVVGDIASRLGFPPEDVAVLVCLVRHHLLLSELATRRDLDDPATVEAVVGAVGDHTRLELLAALTEADSRATGPAAWGTWKAGLVSELVRRSHARLAGSAPPVRSALVTDRHRGFMEQARRLGRSIVSATGPTVTVVARDRPGLLAAVAGVLALHGLDVRSADVIGEGEFAVELFDVEAPRGRWPDWELVADEIDGALRGTLPLDERLAKQARDYAGEHRASSPHPPSMTVEVVEGASANSTVIEIHAVNAVGLLYRITAALFDLDLDVVAARVSTFGDEVVDAFYVRDGSTGGKVTDPARIRRIEQRTLAALTVDPTDGSPAVPRPSSP
ncbi:MAG TPA: [protein-PII] uridylyltransferase [Acidimicrobiales bacterium]|nr:[protein-PII] uridylyltransferase [Acidimicrobiales bacterium]